MRLDHLMWGAADLERGMARARDLFGVGPAPGGVHPGLGTCNALLSLGEAYLEVIAPDPAQPLTGTLGARLRTLTAPGLITWAVASDDLDALADRARSLSLAVRGPVPTERAAPDGRTLRWRLMFVGDHPFGPLIPFFIDWMGTPHPARTNPVGGRLLELVVGTPDADALNGLFEGLALPFEATHAARRELTATVATRGGEIRLDSVADTGVWTF